MHTKQQMLERPEVKATWTRLYYKGAFYTMCRGLTESDQEFFYDYDVEKWSERCEGWIYTSQGPVCAACAALKGIKTITKSKNATRTTQIQCGDSDSLPRQDHAGGTSGKARRPHVRALPAVGTNRNKVRKNRTQPKNKSKIK